MDWRYCILPACYLLGAVPFGVLYAKTFHGVDIRRVGSGNTGATNVLRTCGFAGFIVVLALDTAKGFVSVGVCQHVFGSQPGNEWWVLAGGLLAVVGHNWSVFLGFSGGRGAATGVGVVFAVAPFVALLSFAIWGAVLAATRYVSLASITGGIAAPVLCFVVKYPKPCPLAYQLLVTLAGVLIVLRHRANIKRLLAGTEFKLGQKVDPSQGVQAETNAIHPERPVEGKTERP